MAVVTFESDYFARRYVEETGIDWPVLIDSDRRLYRAYGMERGRWWDLVGPSAWLAYLRLLARGAKLKRTHGDITQLGGDVLVGPEGRVRLHHVGHGPADRPSVESLLQAIDRSAGGSAGSGGAEGGPH